MNILIVAVGRQKAGAEKALFDSYLKRIPWKVEIRELDIRGGRDGPQRQNLEAERILAAVPNGARVIALDERGDNLTSRKFADLLSNWQDDGARRTVIIIGGADGLTDQVRRRADKVVSFGALTWPHMMARVLLAEQLYRATSIISGHPYHRD